MKWSSKAVFVRVAVAAFALGSAGAAMAQAWPTKPVRIIVPFGAGGGTDIQARLLAKYFNDSMKQTFIVDNRAGAGGLIGAELAVQSPPDGKASRSVKVPASGSRSHTLVRTRPSYSRTTATSRPDGRRTRLGPPSFTPRSFQVQSVYGGRAVPSWAELALPSRRSKQRAVPSG